MKRNWKLVTLVAVLALSGCGGGGGGGDGGSSSDTVLLSGVLSTQSLDRAAPRTSAAAVSDSVWVVAIDETGNVKASDEIPFPFGMTEEPFTLVVTTGHDYIVEFCRGSVDGTKLAEFVLRDLTGDRTAFHVPAAMADLDLGVITLDLLAGRGTSDLDDSADAAPDDLSKRLAPPGTTYSNADDDMVPDSFDTDDDNDGIADGSDSLPDDTDNDGLSNNNDPDDDGDGMSDGDDDMDFDTNNNGFSNDRDEDDDGDDVVDSSDDFPLDPSETIDTDDDGTGNNADTDDDNDGIEDSEDDTPLGGDGGTISEVEPNNGITSMDAQLIGPPVIITGTVSWDEETTEGDDIDVFRFVPPQTATYTVTLSGFGSHDLDLYGGTWDEDETYASPVDAPFDGSTESFTYTFTAGRTYYIVVEAWDTGGATVGYELKIRR